MLDDFTNQMQMQLDAQEKLMPWYIRYDGLTVYLIMTWAILILAGVATLVYQSYKRNKHLEKLLITSYTLISQQNHQHTPKEQRNEIYWKPDIDAKYRPKG